MSAEERLLRLENAFTTLVELARNIDERLDDHDSRMNTFEANLSALSDIVAEVAKNQKVLVEQLSDLAANQKRTDEQLSILAANQKRTDEQLGHLAALVDRHIREGG